MSRGSVTLGLSRRIYLGSELRQGVGIDSTTKVSHVPGATIMAAMNAQVFLPCTTGHISIE